MPNIIKQIKEKLDNIFPVTVTAAVKDASSGELLSNTISNILINKQNKLTAGPNININSSTNVISAQVDIPSTNVVAGLYFDSGNILRETETSASISSNITLTGTTVGTISYLYTPTQPIIVSPTSLYSCFIFLNSMQNGRTYTIKAEWMKGVTLISSGTTIMRTPENGMNFINIPMDTNFLTQNLTVLSTETLTLKISINKTNTGNETIQFISNPTYRGAFVRNGGEVTANNVYDLWNGQVITQANINANLLQLSTWDDVDI